MTLTSFTVVWLNPRAVLLSLFLLATVHLANGQEAKEEASSDQSIRKGKVLLGSYFDFSKSTIDRTRVGRSNSSTDALSVGINITGGKMLSDHWGLLLIAGYSESSTTRVKNISILALPKLSKPRIRLLSLCAILVKCPLQTGK